MAGSVHNVNDYAPPGYKLAASHYADGKCIHVFEPLECFDEQGRYITPSAGKALECRVAQYEQETARLASFVASHTGQDPEGASSKAADRRPQEFSGNLTSEAAVRFADTLPAPAPKPAKRKGGNGG